MNLSEVNWDFNTAGTWPLPIKIATIVLVSILVAGAGVYYITLDQLNELDQLEKKEQDLIDFSNDSQESFNCCKVFSPNTVSL